MKLKKITALVLTVSMIAGMTGCKSSKKQEEQITNVIDSYVEGLNDLDADSVLGLTSLSKKDGDYQTLKLVLDDRYFPEVYGNREAKVLEYIFSTITVNYDSEDISIKGDKATAKIEYELVDWNQVLLSGYDDYDDLLDKMKDSDDTMTINAKLSFEEEDGEWLISKITKLDELLDFLNYFPYIDVDPYIDPTPYPTETDPTEESTSFSTEQTSAADLYDEALEAYLYTLEYNEDAIRDVEENFYESAGCLYDFDDDGLPELCYLSVDTNTEYYSSATLHICEYNYFAGEAIDMIVIPNIIYMAADGGSYIIFATDKNIIITHCGGEEGEYHYTTEIYSAFSTTFFTLENVFSRVRYLDYDSYEYSYEYFENKVSCDESYYKKVIGSYIKDADVVINANYEPSKDEDEYPLNDVYQIGFFSYDKLVADIKSALDN